MASVLDVAPHPSTHRGHPHLHVIGQVLLALAVYLGPWLPVIGLVILVNRLI